MANPPEINLITLNCWGLKYLASHRHERLCAIGDNIAAADPVPDIVALQECWTQADYAAICARTEPILPHAKFYHSGILGAGLAVLSRWPIVESSMYAYPLNGRPTAFFRGDWYVGKGVACSTIAVPPGGFTPRGKATSTPTARQPTHETLITLLNTHLHAPYESEPHDSYLAHRTAQAWEVAKLLRAAAERGHLALAAGDFNMVPDSLAHRIVQTHGDAIDTWQASHPDAHAPEHATRNRTEAALSNIKDTSPPLADPQKAPTVSHNLHHNGTTCDSAANTWRWPATTRRRLRTAAPTDPLCALDGAAPDPHAKRLDYIFMGRGGAGASWAVARAHVGMTARHPALHCSLSDHFSVEVTLRLASPAGAADGAPRARQYLDADTYARITALLAAYTARETHQRFWRLGHFGASVAVLAACAAGSYFAAPVAAGAVVVLVLVAGLGTAAGLLDGLIGGFFVPWEMSALREVGWEVRRAAEAAGLADGRSD